MPTKLGFQLIVIGNLIISILTQGIGSSIFFNAICSIYNILAIEKEQEIFILTKISESPCLKSEIYAVAVDLL